MRRMTLISGIEEARSLFCGHATRFKGASTSGGTSGFPTGTFIIRYRVKNVHELSIELLRGTITVHRLQRVIPKALPDFWILVQAITMIRELFRSVGD